MRSLKIIALKNTFLILVIFFLNCFLIPLNAIQTSPLCAEKFQKLLSYQTKGMEKNVSVLGRNVHYTQVELPERTQVVDSDSINWKSYHRDAFAELFFKMIRPSVTNEWKLQKFDLSELLNSNGNELILGLDVNHTYLVLRDGKTGKFIRADGGANTQFFVRDNTETVTSGIFIRFPEISDEQLKILKTSINEGKTFTTCTHAACSSIAKVGVYFGNKEPLPQTTAEALMAVLRGGIQQEGETPLKVEIFTTSSKPFEKQIKQAISVSQINGDIRNKSMKGVLAIFYYGGKTILKWIFIDMPKKAIQSVTMKESDFPSPENKGKPFMIGQYP